MPDRYLVKWDTARSGNAARDLTALDRTSERRKACAIIASRGPVVKIGEPTPVPWITLVLGSECLEIGAGQLNWPDFAYELKEGLRAAHLDSDSVDRVSNFARHIIEDRYPGTVVDPGTVVETDPRSRHHRQLDRWEALLLNATFKLSTSYYQAMEGWNGAISRWGEASIPLLGVHKEGEAVSSERKGNVEALRKLLRELLVEVAGRPKVKALIKRIRDDVGDADDPRLNPLDLKAATELSWQVLMQGEAVAQGWSELLIALSLNEGARDMPEKRPRPGRAGFMNPENVVQGIREVLGELTMQSRERLGDSTLTAREATYKEYARLLHQQAAVRRLEAGGRYDDITLDPSLVDEEWVPTVADNFGDIGAAERLSGQADETPPNPVEPKLSVQEQVKQESSEVGPLEAAAFVTTFDIGLELSLAKHFPGEPFIVALPVEVTATVDGTSRAKGIWMGYVVTPPHDPNGPIEDSITKPAETAWLVLSGAELNQVLPETDPVRALLPGRSTLAGLPFVVRLMGSPLVDLTIPQGGPVWKSILNHTFVRELGEVDPNVAGEDWVPAEHAGLTGVELKNTVILEENQSLRWSIPAAAMGIRSLPRGLPRELTSSTPGFWRYWTLVGVQLSDSVVRHRVMAELVAAGILQQNSTNYRRPKALGMAINRGHVGSRATETLLWSEVDVVQDDCENLNAYLSHYTDHLERAAVMRNGAQHTPGTLEWPSNDRDCRLQ